MCTTVPYRLEVDYLSKEYDNKACDVSSPIFTLEKGIEGYLKHITEKCIDDENKSAKVHLWKYNYTADGELDPITIMKNY